MPEAPSPAGPLTEDAQACQVLVLLCTCPDDDSAGGIATALIAGGLAACVNRVPGVRSLFRWAGQVQEDAEVLLVVKTTAARYDAAEAAIRARHPYDLPEIIALPVSRGHGAYLDWVRQAASGAGT